MHNTSLASLLNNQSLGDADSENVCRPTPPALPSFRLLVSCAVLLHSSESLTHIPPSHLALLFLFLFPLLSLSILASSSPLSGNLRERSEHEDREGPRSSEQHSCGMKCEDDNGEQMAVMRDQRGEQHDDERSSWRPSDLLLSSPLILFPVGYIHELNSSHSHLIYSSFPHFLLSVFPPIFLS